MDLPHFKYHPDPIKTGSVKESDEPCECCEKARGYVYAGSPYSRPVLGTVDTSYYQGDGVTATARADESFDLDYGITADEPGFEKFMRALAYTQWAGQNPTDPDRGMVLAEAMDLTREAIGDLSRIRSGIGANSSVLDAAELRHEQFKTYATEAISDLEDTDLTVAITQLSTDQTLLQASYLSLSRLDSISLVDFLR